MRDDLFFTAQEIKWLRVLSNTAKKNTTYDLQEIDADFRAFDLEPMLFAVNLDNNHCVVNSKAIYLLSKLARAGFLHNYNMVATRDVNWNVGLYYVKPAMNADPEAYEGFQLTGERFFIGDDFFEMYHLTIWNEEVTNE